MSNMAMNSAKEEVRQTHVSSSLDCLDKAASELQATAAELSKRLTVVCRTEPTPEGTEKSALKPIKVGLAMAIDEKTERISQATLRIREIINSLEL